VLEVELDLALELLVVRVPSAHLEIHQVAKGVIKRQQLPGLFSVGFDLVFKVGVFYELELVVAAVVADAILWQELLDSDAL